METKPKDPAPRVFRSFAQAVLIGVGGNWILFFFLLTFLHVLNAVRFLPWILAFNAASTGYLLVEKTAGRLPRRSLTAAIAGALTVIFACAGIGLGIQFLLGRWVFPAADLVFFLLVGLGCSELGMLLGVKYRQIKNELNP